GCLRTVRGALGRDGRRRVLRVAFLRAVVRAMTSSLEPSTLRHRVFECKGPAPGVAVRRGASGGRGRTGPSLPRGALDSARAPTEGRCPVRGGDPVRRAPRSGRAGVRTPGA